ncbi:flagellar motor protein MotA [Neobacillus bataviensis LMG 21833]|uniref:Flagellar motor protein MotA n=1 Tax=Neobacillus bataviensis LMG 21833 TaxID=1117379 RepID=K6D8T8_9BACI|nr:flagellar motor stator protein MotA [Neobacillus bataviensis]EKN64734.1 flagellar motor protein MotA [Neobacillus bataviensis LMG 21833]
MTTIIGLLLAIIFIGVGMVLKGVSVQSLANPAAFLIIFGGTIAALLVAFPMSEIKKLPQLLRIAFLEPKLPTQTEIIDTMVEWSIVARTEGVLALEEIAETVDDPFLKNGLEMIIDGSDRKQMEEILYDELESVAERHKVGALIFSQAGMYAPTLGVLGAVVGLIAALGNLKDMDKLGYSIAAAFIATLLGIFSGYVLWHPISNKLKRISKKEQDIKVMMIDGLLAIQDGLTPKLIERKLSVYLPSKARIKQEEMISEAAEIF